MKPIHNPLRPIGLAFLAALLASALVLPGAVQAQSSPPQRVIRTYIPPDQLVSFLPSTPFPQFVEFLSPIVQRVTGKQIIDPEGREMPINIAISGMHFLDAFELVLEYQGLTYRETDQFFIVEPVAAPGEAVAVVPGKPAPAARGERAVVPATSDTREIKINAMLFDLNLSRAREVGLDWNSLFGENAEVRVREGDIVWNSGNVFGADGAIGVPGAMSFRTITQTLRALETDGLGRTVANPTVTVQSGQEGKIQIGSDVPVQTRDFAGNTITQFFATGTIVDVKPTLITEVADDTTSVAGPEFIHMDIHVEKSNSRPSSGGLIIDRNQADTQVLLLPGEQTVIGGLVSTDEVVTRKGVPVLKDLPGWFFGLRYLFGVDTKTVIQRELLIVLQAEVLDPLDERAGRPFDNELLERRRREAQENIRRVDEGAGAGTELPPFSTAKQGGRQ